MPNWKYSFSGLDKDKTAIASGRDLKTSPKKTREVCNTIKGMSLEKAKTFLEGVILIKTPVPFRRSNKKVRHRHGMHIHKFPAGVIQKNQLNLYMMFYQMQNLTQSIRV